MKVATADLTNIASVNPNGILKSILSETRAVEAQQSTQKCSMGKPLLLTYLNQCQQNIKKSSNVGLTFATIAVGYDAGH